MKSLLSLKPSINHTLGVYVESKTTGNSIGPDEDTVKQAGFEQHRPSCRCMQTGAVDVLAADMLAIA